MCRSSWLLRRLNRTLNVDVLRTVQCRYVMLCQWFITLCASCCSDVVSRLLLFRGFHFSNTISMSGRNLGIGRCFDCIVLWNLPSRSAGCLLFFASALVHVRHMFLGYYCPAGTTSATANPCTAGYWGGPSQTTSTCNGTICICVLCLGICVFCVLLSLPCLTVSLTQDNARQATGKILWCYSITDISLQVSSRQYISTTKSMSSILDIASRGQLCCTMFVFGWIWHCFVCGLCCGPL